MKRLASDVSPSLLRPCLVVDVKFQGDSVSVDSKMPLVNYQFHSARLSRHAPDDLAALHERERVRMHAFKNNEPSAQLGM